MAKVKIPATPATRFLKEQGIPFKPHLYAYEDRGGTNSSARELGVDEHCVIKTLIMEDNNGNPLLVLMHGDREVSTRELARLLEVKTVQPCTPATARKHSGYLVGGTSPFGTRRQMPVYMESTIQALGRLYINGGKRGFLVEMAPADVVSILKPVFIEVGISK